jgi:alpha-tubulin suppressor-like RCC1 family protein
MLVPTKLKINEAIESLAIGNNHALALTKSGHVLSWGREYHDQPTQIMIMIETWSLDFIWLKKNKTKNPGLAAGSVGR